MNSVDVRRPSGDIVSMVVGGAVGAVIRFLLVGLEWGGFAPTMIATLVVAFVGSVLAGISLATRIPAMARSFAVGMGGAMASLTGFVMVAVGYPPAALALLIIAAPLAVLAGLATGAVAGVMTRGSHRRAQQRR